MKPYYQDESVTIYHGDAREIMPQLAEPIDLVLTDPPYGRLDRASVDCDSTRFSRGPRGNGGPSLRRYAPMVGDDRPFDPSPFLDYPRVVLWGSNHYSEGLPRGTTLVWLKRFDPAFGSFLSDGEIAWLKGGHGVYAHRDTSLCGETRTHQTQKPVGLMRWCIRKAGGDGMILDPFMGTGATLRAAKDEGRRAIGIEIEERHCEIAAGRMAQGVLSFEGVA